MFKNYLKTTFRNLWKNKGYSMLNIGGLAVGIACAGLILLWVEDELTFNHYFSNRDNLYKIKDRQTYDGQTFTFDATPGKLAQGILAEIPGIKNTARTTWRDNLLFTLDDKSIYERGLYADASFLSMFGLRFLEGNPKNAFTQLHSLVITQAMAKKFFGTTNAIGKSLKVDNKHDYIVTGVIEDLPENVSFEFHWLAPFKIYEDQNPWLQFWGNNGIITYVETHPGANISTINNKLHNYVAQKQEGALAKMSIYPMNRWRMYDSFENGKEVAGRIKYVRLFSIIAWIILIIACINFMNLSTARSEQRAREVGVRKVLGAGKGKLVGQFLSESILMSFISAGLALVIMFLSIRSFNGIVEKQLSVNVLQPSHLLALTLIALLCGLVAGSYPAFYLSAFNPVNILKGIKLKKSGSAAYIRKGLVVLQFSISVILIISTVIIYQQIIHVKSRDLGYQKQDLLFTGLEGNMKQHFYAIKNDLLASGFVQNASMSRNQVLQMGNNTGGFEWEGKDPNKQVLITVESVSPEYITTMGMTLKAGRDFKSNATADSNNVIINDGLARIINRKDIIGSTLSNYGTKFTIIGVVKDFVYNDMYSPPAPLIIFADTNRVNYLAMRLKSNTNLAQAKPAIEKIIKSYNPDYPFECRFLDAEFDKLFKTETLIGKLAAIFSALAIFISCLGLFGLAAYTAERRTKEIGVRKVLGASTQALAALLSRDFLQLVGISCLISFPLAWWAMNKWLQSFAYRVEIHWTVFVFSGLLAMLIAISTVSFQAVKAAIANPVKSLRTE
jgi:putative ABC transport system permease protein